MLTDAELAQPLIEREGELDAADAAAHDHDSERRRLAAASDLLDVRRRPLRTKRPIGRVGSACSLTPGSSRPATIEPMSIEATS